MTEMGNIAETSPIDVMRKTIKDGKDRYLAVPHPENGCRSRNAGAPSTIPDCVDANDPYWSIAKSDQTNVTREDTVESLALE